MRSHPWRFIVSVVTLSVVTFGFTSVAGADRPTRDPFPQDALDFADLCSFPVHIDITVNKEHITTFASGNIAGQQLITGDLKVHVINTSTHHAVDLTVSGPIRLIPHEDGSLGVVSLGATLWPFTDAQPGLPRLAVVDGRLEALFDPTFRVTSVTGHVVDVCALLS